jgi:hypothetical protein
MICMDRYDAMLEWCSRTLGWCVFFVVPASIELSGTTNALSLRNRDREQTDLKLKPAVEAQQNRQQQGTQQRLSQYFEPSRRVASIRSVRMANAVQKLGNAAVASSVNGSDAKSGSDSARSAQEPFEPKAADDTALDAAAALLKKQKQKQKAVAPAKKQPKTKKKKTATNSNGSPKSTRSRSGYMIFLCADWHSITTFIQLDTCILLCTVLSVRCMLTVCTVRWA